MALYTFVYDNTGKRRAVAYPGFVDTVSTPVSSTTNFVISGVTVDSAHVIDAWVAGRLQTDGVHFNRDLVHNWIVFTSNVDPGQEVKIRVYLK